jgi:hypothetical protein
MNASKVTSSPRECLPGAVRGWPQRSWLGAQLRSTRYSYRPQIKSRGSSPRHIWTAPSLLLLFLFEVHACLQLLCKLNRVQQIAPSSPVLTSTTRRSRYPRTAQARYQSSLQPASSTQASTKPTAKMAHAMSDDQVYSLIALLRQPPPQSSA